MTALLVSIFVASLLGSVHCVGMCGPLVAITVGGRAASRHSFAGPSAAYHSGRLLAYALLGALAGRLGSMLNLAPALGGIAPVASVVAGVTLILMATVQLLRVGGFSLKASALPASLQSMLTAANRFAMRRGPVARGLLLGVITGALPCGWLYAFVITAAGTGSAHTGAIAMVAFWLGTVPALLIVALGARSLLSVCNRKLTVAASVVLLGVGLLTVLQRSQLSAVAMASPTTQAAAQIVAQEEVPDCCKVDRK
jgi:uncharacterized protein